MYYVYVHTVPNGKIYIGQAKDLERRWANGEGYQSNRPFYKDILIYGWNAIKHEVIAQFPERETAVQLEAVLIALFKSEDDAYGYNQTTIYRDAMKRFAAKVPHKSACLESAVSEEGFFEAYNLPISACEEMIEQWVYNKKHRQIAKSRLIDGLSYSELTKEYGLSVRQLKRIVYDVCSKLEKRM